MAVGNLDHVAEDNVLASVWTKEVERTSFHGLQHVFGNADSTIVGRCRTGDKQRVGEDFRIVFSVDGQVASNGDRTGGGEIEECIGIGIHHVAGDQNTGGGTGCSMQRRRFRNSRVADGGIQAGFVVGGNADVAIDCQACVANIRLHAGGLSRANVCADERVDGVEQHVLRLVAHCVERQSCSNGCVARGNGTVDGGVNAGIVFCVNGQVAVSVNCTFSDAGFCGGKHHVCGHGGIYCQRRSGSEGTAAG